jgi:hypothetical protein
MPKDDEEKTKEEQLAKKKKARNLRIVEVIFVVAMILFVAFYVNEYLQKNQPPEPEPELTPANVQLEKFIDLFGTINQTKHMQRVNIELWLTNIGEQPATNISIYIRTRSDNGTLLFNGTIDLTTMMLRPGESCTGDYAMTFYDDKTQNLHHTIEVSWNGGRNTYSKETRQIKP